MFTIDDLGFAVIGFLAIAVTSTAGLDALKRVAVPLFHGVAGLVMTILTPLLFLMTGAFTLGFTKRD